MDYETTIWDFFWRTVAALKRWWCILLDHHNPQPVYGEMSSPEIEKQVIPYGFATICDKCTVISLYNGRHLYGRKVS